VNTARARRSGLSNPTVQTRKGKASMRLTGSSGMRRYPAIGSATIKDRTEEARMAVLSQKLDPRLREDRNSRMKVVCMRMYPAKTKRMSKESAFCGVTYK
jgi:hypothetical protein